MLRFYDHDLDKVRLIMRRILKLSWVKLNSKSSTTIFGKRHTFIILSSTKSRRIASFTKVTANLDESNLFKLL